MMIRAVCLGLPGCLLLGACAEGPPAEDRSVPVSSMEWNADSGGIHAVKHVIIVMQENHSFDNYLGALAYAQVARTTGRSRLEPGPATSTLAARRMIIAASTGFAA